MRFSVIIQSYLGNYNGAASNREEKIIRAINSVLSQSFQDLEIIVVADGCEKTYDIVCANYLSHEKVECFLIQKQTLWSGKARNFGIKKAQGDYIVYLDIDDYWEPEHLFKIDSQLGSYDWVFFNDLLLLKTGVTHERQCFKDQKFHNGTSNICHRKNLDIRWDGAGYGLDDWSIVSSLNRFSNNAKIETPGYVVCHIPSRLDK